MSAASALARLRPQVGDDRSRLVDGDDQALLALGLLELARRRRLPATSPRRVLDAATESSFELGRPGRPLVLLHGRLDADDLLAGEQLLEQLPDSWPLEAVEVARLELPGVSVDEVSGELEQAVVDHAGGVDERAEVFRLGEVLTEVEHVQLEAAIAAVDRSELFAA